MESPRVTKADVVFHVSEFVADRQFISLCVGMQRMATGVGETPDDYQGRDD